MSLQEGDTDRRAANRQLAQKEYREGRFVLHSRPRVLVVELTRHCNLACPMCRLPGEVAPSARMSERIFARLESELFPTADMIDLRGWGESLILPEFPDRAWRAARHGAALRIVTNLSFQRPAILDLLAELSFHVGVSIDSTDSATLSFLRGGARLALIEANLARLASGLHKKGLGHQLTLYVTCQLPALPTIDTIVDLAARHGIRDVRLAPVGTSLPFLSLAGARHEVDMALERIRGRAEEHGVRVSMTASLVEGLAPNTAVEACLHPWAWCYITYDGRLGFCDHLVGNDGYLLGSLAEGSFDEIWNGAAWTKLRREHLSGRRASAPHFHECAWCYRNRHVDSENVIEPSYDDKRAIVSGCRRDCNGLSVARR